MLLSSASQGLLWAVMAIGVYLTFRILDIADLTAEGSFPLGAAVCATLIVGGWSPLPATIMAFFVGTLAGLVSGLLHTVLRIPALLTGILTMTALYSINLRIMGKANVGLGSDDKVLTMGLMSDMGLTNNQAVLVVGGIAVAIVILVLYFFFNTSLGLAIRATGDNEEMSMANGIHTGLMKIIGYMLSNGLIALSGALMMQNNGYADINMGIGTIVIGLASIIIGEVVFKNLRLVYRLMMIVLGAIVYRLIIIWVMNRGVEVTDLKLFSAVVLTLALSTPLIREKLSPFFKGFSKSKSTQPVKKK